MALQSKTTKKSYIESKPDNIYHYESSNDEMISQDSKESIEEIEAPKM